MRYRDRQEVKGLIFPDARLSVPKKGSVGNTRVGRKRKAAPDCEVRPDVGETDPGLRGLFRLRAIGVLVLLRR